MLLAFRTANFRSLRDEAELSMMVPSWAPADDRVLVPVPGAGDQRVGTVAALYGPNASGKSNVLAAMSAMLTAVRDSHQRWPPAGGAPHDPFLLDSEHQSQPTLFEAEVLLDRQRWQYGFRLDSVGIGAEWLYSFPRGKRRTWFERSRSGDFYVGKSLTGPVATLRELMRPNSLFLSVGAANNHPELTKLASWFLQQMLTASKDYHFGTATLLANNSRLGPRVQELLTFADLGITHADARLRTDSDRVSLELLFHHRAGNHQAVMKLEQESLGTLTWFALLGPVVAALDLGGTVIVDELDSSLHPHLLARLIELFHDPSVNEAGAQLIFTTHDTSLLGSLATDQPLRRDELWFTEKDGTGASRLYPLTDFHPRKQENLERGYLQGRYGAVPILPAAPHLNR